MPGIDKLFRDYERMLKRLEAEEAASKRVYSSKRSKKKCGAYARSTGKPCQAKALTNGRCKLHGGLSTGPKTDEGKAKALANLKQYKSVA
ncbi:HGGxSTG domain-containing protein [Pseudomonadota bacterium]